MIARTIFPYALVCTALIACGGEEGDATASNSTAGSTTASAANTATAGMPANSASAGASATAPAGNASSSMMPQMQPSMRPPNTMTSSTTGMMPGPDPTGAPMASSTADAMPENPDTCPAAAPMDGDECGTDLLMEDCAYTDVSCTCRAPFTGGMGGMGGAIVPLADAGDVAPQPAADAAAAAGVWNCDAVQPEQPVEECPATAPTDGDTCTGMLNCEYDATTCRCQGAGGMGGMGGGGAAAARTWNCGDGMMPPVPGQDDAGPTPFEPPGADASAP